MDAVPYSSPLLPPSRYLALGRCTILWQGVGAAQILPDYSRNSIHPVLFQLVASVSGTQ
uniref:Uncharacterized protein n=1 Tax=Anguilla anguilla TaxID=7936 RepID=A0A0E9T5D6_ANGAN